MCLRKSFDYDRIKKYEYGKKEAGEKPARVRRRK